MQEQFPQQLEGTVVPEGQEVQSEQALDTNIAQDTMDRPVPAFGPPTTEVPIVDYGRVKDKDLALEMAYASKPEREEAAKDRLMTDVGTIAKIIGDEADQEGDVHELEDEFRSKVDRLEKLTGEDVPSHERVNSFYVEEAVKVAENDYSADSGALMDEAVRYEKKSERADAVADKIEKWTEILHQNPISEAYRQSNNLDVRQLVSMEESVEQAQAAISLQEELISIKAEDAMAGVKGIDGLSPSRLIDIAYPVESEDPAVQASRQEYLQATADPNTTLGQLRDIYVKAYRSYRVEPFERKIQDTQKVLDDIKSGVASS